jgi:hypothetical protein
MRFSGRAIGRLVCAVAAGAALLRPSAASPQFISMSANPRAVLEGNWQSCLEPGTGRYAERVYDHVVNGVGQYEVHLGPRREFAIFVGVQDAHREHDSPENLLKPFRVPAEGDRGSMRWEIPSLNLVFSASAGGGSSATCESWYILLTRTEKPS